MFASEAAKGRERLAATLLAAPEGWAASDIVAKLPTVDASLKRDANAAADAVWDRARARAQGQVPPAASASESDALWDRAWAKVADQRGVAR